MKNLTSLIIVLCLLIVLGCKCQSDLFDKSSPTPSPSASASPSPTSSPTPSPSPSGESSSENRNRRPVSSSENSVLSTGSYTGRGKNLTTKQNGEFLLRIDSVDADGNVKGYLEASNGLTGSATMTGTVTKGGKIEMSGTMSNGDSAAINGTVSGRTISAGFGIANSKLETQSGNFVVSMR